MTPHTMRHTLKQRIIALVLLMAYTITGTTVLPAAVALAAWADGSHSVVISSSEAGTRLNLLHRSDEYTPAINDHGSALARMIVSFCHASNQGDHQISSSQLDISVSLERDEFERINVLSPAVQSATEWHHAKIMPSNVPATFISSRLQESRLSHSDIGQMLATVQLIV